jgi:hypothetical protein
VWTGSSPGSVCVARPASEDIRLFTNTIMFKLKTIFE